MRFFDYIGEQINPPDFNKELQELQEDSYDQSSDYAVGRQSGVSGPNAGANMRKRGSPKKTFKMQKIELTEDEITLQWTSF